MDIAEEDTFIRSCFTCEQPVLDNLNIVYNTADSKLILWNKYQLFVYEYTVLKSPEKILIPEFQIRHVIASNNHLLCMDCAGTLHITSLKFKSCANKRSKTDFQPREESIKTCIRYKEDYILSLKRDANAYFLCLHRFDIDFELEKKISLLCDTERWPIGESAIENYLLTSRTINKDTYEYLKKIFRMEESMKNTLDLVILSFDKLAVYGCLFSPKTDEDETILVKLYVSPVEICNVEIVDSDDLFLLIGLTVGSVVRISLYNLSKTPDVVHLNTALYKMVVFDDNIIYSDGITMWKSENTFSDDIKLTRFFINNVKDFVKCGDQIVCTTFSKLVYKFSIEDKKAYVIPITTEEYCSAEKLFSNQEYLKELFENIDLNNELSAKLTRERDYITAMSLSQRQDLITQAIEISVLVLETYDEASNLECILTEELKEYFNEDNWLFLVKIVNTNIFDTLNEILSNFSDSIRIHVTFTSPHRVLKTTSLKLNALLKTVHFLIPLNLKTDLTEINLNIKIIMSIPGVLHKKQKTLTILYKKDIVLTSEHFIKTNKIAPKTLKKPRESIEDLIQNTASIQHGAVFQFTDVSKLKESETEWSFYVKLPNDYEELFKSDKYCKRYLSPAKSTFLTQLWGTEEFLKSETHISLSIGKEKVKIKVENDEFSNPLLNITGDNPKITFNLRNFFSMMVYNKYESHGPGKEFIDSYLYTTTENIKKKVKCCIKESATSEEFLKFNNQFEKDVIGSLPL